MIDEIPIFQLVALNEKFKLLDITLVYKCHNEARTKSSFPSPLKSHIDHQSDVPALGTCDLIKEILVLFILFK